jgi:diadenosine tetraphosphate (Ap4A) HIT family hydrolase
MGSNGTLLVESRRHFLDFGAMRENEGKELTGILRRLFPAMKKATGAERIYSVAMMDGVPHFHLWLVPRKRGERLRGVSYLASEQTPPTLDDVEETVRLIERGLHSKGFRLMDVE